MAYLEAPAESVIKIKNKEIKLNISEVQLDQYIDNHHQLTVTVKNADARSNSKEFIDPEEFTAFLGESISLNMTIKGDIVANAPDLEFVGVVTDIQFENTIDSLNNIIIHAASPTIALDSGAKNAHYYDQKASDIISSILNKYQISIGNIESTSGTMKFDTQYRETDYDYIMRLAKGSGLFACYTGTEFVMTKAVSDDSIELVWRRDLGSFRVGLGTAPLEFQSDVYNYEQKKTYTQDSKSISQTSSLSDYSKTAQQASGKIYQESSFSGSPKTVEDAKSLDNTLEKDRKRAMGSMVRCTGQSMIPGVAVGKAVNISKMEGHDGQYWVKGVRHIFDESGKYHNIFVCAPLDIAYPENKPAKRDLDVEEKPIKTETSVDTVQVAKKKQIVGLHTARVVDIEDPLQLGRIKISYPWLNSEQTAWVRIAVPHAGPDRGWYALPELEDEVLVGFEHGDTDLPVILGALYNKDNAPMAEAINDQNNIKMFMTRSGNKILFNDEDGSEQIVIATKDGENQITLDMSGPSISISSKGDISIKGKNLSFEAEGGITMNAEGDFKFDGTNFETSVSANAKIKSGANCDIEGSAQTNIKGGIINLN